MAIQEAPITCGAELLDSYDTVLIASNPRAQLKDWGVLGFEISEELRQPVSCAWERASQKEVLEVLFSDLSGFSYDVREAALASQGVDCVVAGVGVGEAVESVFEDEVDGIEGGVIVYAVVFGHGCLLVGLDTPKDVPVRERWVLSSLGRFYRRDSALASII